MAGVYTCFIADGDEFIVNDVLLVLPLGTVYEHTEGGETHRMTVTSPPEVQQDVNRITTDVTYRCEFVRSATP